MIKCHLGPYFPMFTLTGFTVVYQLLVTAGKSSEDVVPY